jgi:ferritin
MLSKKMLEEFNRQIKQEFSSAYYYLGLAGFAELNNFTGGAKFFRMQYEEELVHALKLFDYVVQRRDGHVELRALSAVKIECTSLLEAFEVSLKNEQATTEGIHQVLDLAHNERDYATMTLLNWFAEEQAEEEALMQYFTERLRMVGNEGSGLLLVDNELSQRESNPAEE